MVRTHRVPSNTQTGSPSKVNGNGSAKRKPTPSSSTQPNGRAPDSPRKKKQRIHPSIAEQRSELPIAAGKDGILREIEQNDVVVLLGETGSGKTTQVPQYILESGLARDGIIAVTQPRRVAAISLAERVAFEQETTVGARVGYAVRFDESAGADTRIKFVTDGMLVRELLADPLLSRYAVVVVDEAHERTLRTDLLLANLKSILARRAAPADRKGKAKHNPLKVVIMSATLDAEKFSRYFNNAKVLYVKGRQHPVQIFHTAAGVLDYQDAALRTFYQIHTDQPPGDVLIFLPGQDEIDTLEKAINTHATKLPRDSPGVLTCPMYAALPHAVQARVFAPAPAHTRKCILATNVAETSITIPGVRYVVDTGKFKEKRYVPASTGIGFDTLLLQSVSKSAAMQRTGRAGREGKGFCFRLYSEAAFNALPLSSEPEILRCNLAASLLELKCLDQDLEDLDFIDNPDREAITSALHTLFILGAIDANRGLTPAGRHMAALPLDPPLARALLASKEHACTSEVLTITALLSSTSKLFHDNPNDDTPSTSNARGVFRHASGDHLTLLAAARAYAGIVGHKPAERREWCTRHGLNERAFKEANDIRAQLARTCERLGIDCSTSCGDDEGPILRSLLRGMVQNAALLQPDGSYRQVMGRETVKIHPGSVLMDKKVPAIMYNELVHTTQLFARTVSSVPLTYFQDVDSITQRR